MPKPKQRKLNDLNRSHTPLDANRTRRGRAEPEKLAGSRDHTWHRTPYISADAQARAKPGRSFSTVMVVFLLRER